MLLKTLESVRRSAQTLDQCSDLSFVARLVHIYDSLVEPMDVEPEDDFDGAVERDANREADSALQGAP